MQAAFTPRQRQEIEPSSLLQSRQETCWFGRNRPFDHRPRAGGCLLSGGRLWVANVTAAGNDYSLCLVAPAGSPTVANAAGVEAAIAANTSDFVVEVQAC